MIFASYKRRETDEAIYLSFTSFPFNSSDREAIKRYQLVNDQEWMEKPRMLIVYFLCTLVASWWERNPKSCALTQTSHHDTDKKSLDSVWWNDDHYLPWSSAFSIHIGITEGNMAGCSNDDSHLVDNRKPLHHKWSIDFQATPHKLCPYYEAFFSLFTK